MRSEASDGPKEITTSSELSGVAIHFVTWPHLQLLVDFPPARGSNVEIPADVKWRTRWYLPRHLLTLMQRKWKDFSITLFARARVPVEPGCDPLNCMFSRPYPVCHKKTEISEKFRGFQIFFFFISSTISTRPRPDKISYEILCMNGSTPSVPGSVAVAYMRDLEILILMKGNWFWC